jgi:hypothetical protein
VLCALVAACGGGGGETVTVPGPTTTATTTVTTTETETVASTVTEPAGPPFGTAPVSGPASGTGTALLRAVRLGAHAGYDRIVFEFRAGTRPGYRVRYVRPPIVEDASGRTVRVAGNAFLSIRMEPASGFDLTGSAGQTYTGPKRISGSAAGTSIVLELVETGDFEAVLNWVAGLETRAPFRVLALDGPPRIVVDVRGG